MREKKSIGEFMRVIMLAVLCILLAMLGLRLCKDWLEDLKIRWENQGITLAGKSSSAAGEIVEFVWNRRQQTMGAEGQGQKKKETVSLTGFMELLNPWNSYEREEKALPPAEKDRDPAYKNFLASREFYIEHQYLLEYGDEESGQESILADSESGAGTMGSEGFENRTETPSQFQGQNPAGDSQGVSGTVYSMAQLADYDFLMKTFYNTHTSTTAGRDMMSAEKMLGTDLSIKKDGASPQILIYHSHSQEAFADSGQNQTIVSRGADSKDGKRPQLSDLRESGAIEQDADIVCFIHRPEYYLRSGVDAAGNDIRGLAEFIVAKHRSGRVDDVKMRFKSRYARFENWDGEVEMSSGMRESRLNSGNFSDMPSPLSGGTADIMTTAAPGDIPPF